MKIYVCVGSGCHIKGSYQILALFKQKLAKHQLIDKISIQTTFCLGNCAGGISIKVDEQIIGGISLEQFDDFFTAYILAKARGEGLC